MLLVIISAAVAVTLSVASSPNTLCSVPKISNGRIGRRVSRHSGIKYFEQVSESETFKDGEELALVCASWSANGWSRKTISNIACSQGKWTPEPNCKPADCAEPLNIPHAKLEKTSASHGSFATYTFEGRFKLMGNPRVQCLFGEWKYVSNCEDRGCPEEEPFDKYKHRDTRKFRDNLIKAFCESYDFVWKGTLSKKAEKLGNGFFNITFQIDEVVKSGSEKKKDIEGKTRTLLTKENCVEPFVGVTYLIAGKDGKSYQNAREETWYRYMLDKTSAVYLYEEDAEDSKLQRVMERATKTLIDQGCDLWTI